MPLQPVTRRSVPDEVFDQVLAEVVEGEIGAGEPLPSERRLAEVLGVSRPAVREALQRRAATRLVEVRHGGATTVRDFKQYAGLDLLPRLLVRDGELDPAVARSIVEARFVIAPGMVRIACRRSAEATATARAALSTSVEDIASAEDPVGRQRAALAFWDTVVDLADSLVFRLLFNNLRQAYEPAMEALAPLLEGEVSNLAGYRAVVRAVLAGHGEDAVAAVEDLLRPATEAIVAFLDDVEGEEG